MSPLEEMKEDRHACNDKEWEKEKKEKGEGGATADRRSLALLKKPC